MKKIIILLSASILSFGNLFCLFESKKKEDSPACSGTPVIIGQRIYGSLSSSDPVDEGYVNDTYCVTTAEGEDYKAELWTDSGKTVFISTETEEGEEDILSSNNYFYIVETSDGGTAVLYISTYISNVTSSKPVDYSFKISQVE